MEIKNLTFEPNKKNGGISATFELGEVRYFADLCVLPYYGSECMIFRVENGKVNWHDLYCKRGIPVTEAQLRKCIDDFAENGSNEGEDEIERAADAIGGYMWRGLCCACGKP